MRQNKAQTFLAPLFSEHLIRASCAGETAKPESNLQETGELIHSSVVKTIKWQCCIERLITTESNDTPINIK